MQTTDILMNETERTTPTREKYKETDALQICPLCLSSVRQDMSCLQSKPLIQRKIVHLIMLHLGMSIYKYRQYQKKKKNSNAYMPVQLWLDATDW